MNKIIYISLTGMTEPLGQSQVLEYLIDLTKKGNKFYLISFERENDLQNIEKIKEITNKYNIEWYYFIYSNKYGIFSTIKQLYDLLKKGSYLIQKESIKIIHARSMIPATIGLILKKVYKVKLLFDIRGFAIDEKLDSGRLKKKSLLFKSLKILDNYLYKTSDHIVTLTHKAKKILNQTLSIPDTQITVIPTCASKDIFQRLDIKEKESFRTSLGYKQDDIVIIHTGTVSGWYDFEKEVKLIKELTNIAPNMRFLILNKNEHDFISNLIKKYQIPNNNIKILTSSFENMYKYLNISDFSIFFIKPSYSKQASAPTKFAENVACYLPSITNKDVGDMEYYLNNYKVGHLVDLDHINNKSIFDFITTYDISKKDYDILFNKYFDKKIAVEKYQQIYKELLGK